jgi:hypothetical protein
MHPVVLAAVIVLVVNDWVLKEHFHGAVTGKLSDISGLIFAPCVLSAAIGLALRAVGRDGRVTRARAVACTVATGAGFAAVKIWPTAAEWLAAALSHLGRPAEIYLDRTDLLALPALAVAAWVFADELARVRSTSAPTAAPADRP